MLRTLLLLATLVLAVPALAQPPACARHDGKWDLDFAKLWAEEANRFKGSAASISRQGERLSLGLEGGKSVELTDCPHGNSGHYYIFDKYDDAGRFYVLGKTGYEDFNYTLVMRRTGRLLEVAGLPIWPTDKSRFLSVGCAIARDQKALTIYAPSGDGFGAEAEIALPCDMESCAARWDNPFWILVTCTPFDDPDKRKKGTEFVVLRGHDGAWTRFGR